MAVTTYKDGGGSLRYRETEGDPTDLNTGARLVNQITEMLTANGDSILDDTLDAMKVACDTAANLLATVTINVGGSAVDNNNPLAVTLWDGAGKELDFQSENDNWNAADHGILFFGRDIESTPNKYRALALNTEGDLYVDLSEINGTEPSVDEGVANAGCLRIVQASDTVPWGAAGSTPTPVMQAGMVGAGGLTPLGASAAGNLEVAIVEGGTLATAAAQTTAQASLTSMDAKLTTIDTVLDAIAASVEEPTVLRTFGQATATATTIATPGAGKTIRVLGLFLVNNGAADITATLQSDATTPVAIGPPILLSAGGGGGTWEFSEGAWAVADAADDELVLALSATGTVGYTVLYEEV